MGTIIKSFFQSISEIPEGKFPPEYYTPRVVRTYVFGTYGYPFGLIIHGLLLVIFALIGVTALSLFNIASVILWVAALLLHRRGYFWQGYFLMTIEIISHAALCTALIGWEAGFQYYILVQPAAVFFLHWNTARKVAVAAIYSCAYIVINFYATVSVPYIKISSIYIAAFNYSNIFSDGVYEVEKTDGSMWRFQEFADFLSNVKTGGHSILDRLYNYAKNLGGIEKFEDDFTILEVAFG